MARFDIQAHEVLMASAISDGCAPRIRLEGLDPATAAPSKTWLYFEPIPGLYAAKGGIGFGKAEQGGERGGSYWVYLDRSTFDEVCHALSANSSIGVRLKDRTHPGAAGANRLVTAIELVVKNTSAIDAADDRPSLLSTSA